MDCPNCGTVTLESDRFCEECGTPLNAMAAASRSSPPASPGCKKCGAGPEELDPEGYCSHCGFRNEDQNPGMKNGPPDRIELVRSPQLVGVSDRGLRHAHNEDFLELAVIDAHTHALVVCDGVSSSQEPAQAAKVAAEQSCAALVQAVQAGADPTAALKQAIAAAMTAVCTLPSAQASDSDPPSTTLVAALVQPQQATIAWLGDSRAYWITATEAHQLTQDDSWVNEAVSSGRMTEAEALQSPHAHAITRWLGADAQGDADPTIVQVPLPKPGYLLLCTDGLWNYTPTAQHLATLVRSLPPDTTTIARGLVEFARSRGGHDNITVALLAQ